jgi:hypothetical protein
MAALGVTTWILAIAIGLAAVALRIRKWADSRAALRRSQARLAVAHYHDGPRGQSLCFGGDDCPDGGEDR